MKLNSRLVSAILVVLLSTSTLAALKHTPFDSGVAFAPADVVTGRISTAGGGVILRDVASCNASTSDICDFQLVQFLPRPLKNSHTVRVTTEKCIAEYKADNWSLMSALDLVSSETNKVFRNINLLGKPKEEDIRALLDKGISPQQVWYIEVSPALAQTKAGETLLTLDLLLTDPAHYSTNPSVTGFVDIIQAHFRAKGVSNWTWTDEQAHSSYSVNCKKETLNLYGKPEFTFLDHSKSVIHLNNSFKTVIQALNPALIDDSVKFAKIAAFLRHVKNNYPEIWEKLKLASKELPRTSGQTPRLLVR